MSIPKIYKKCGILYVLPEETPRMVVNLFVPNE